jgi:DNA-binding transcriptional ArsR family regulator
MNTQSIEMAIADFLRTLAQPARLSILFSIGEGEACVCHLEALLGLRQAYISQHLMELRKEGLLNTRRDGRYIFYRLRDTAILQLIREASQILGIADDSLDHLIQGEALPQCCCPNCVAELNTSVITEEHITSN